MINALAPLAFARPMLSRMKSSTAGLMLPSTAMRSTCGVEASVDSAKTAAPIDSREKKKTVLRVFTTHLFDDFLDVFPHQFLVRRVAQKIGRMKGRHQLDAVVAGPIAAQSADRRFALQ